MGTPFSIQAINLALNIKIVEYAWYSKTSVLDRKKVCFYLGPLQIQNIKTHLSPITPNPII